MKKIKWNNVAKLLLLIFCVGVVIHDVFMLTIYGFITGNHCSLTWFGFITLCIAYGVACMLYEDFKEIYKNTPSYQPKHAKGMSK